MWVSFPILFLLFDDISAGLTMMIVWGELEDVSNCTKSNISTFMPCSSQCYSTSDCILAFMDLSNPSCYLCSFQSIDKVVATTYQDNFKTAMKVNASSCPISISEEGQIMSGYNQANGQSVANYTIKYTNGSWQFQFSETAIECPSDWHSFQRKMGTWCIFVHWHWYYNSTYIYNTFDDSQALCAEANSTLTSIETSAELSLINDLEAAQVDADSYIWLGVQRSAQCIAPNWSTSICNDSITTGFECTDGFTTGTNGFQWAGGYSTINDRDGNPANCAAMITNKNDATVNGLLSSFSCTYSSYSIQFQGFACGGQPAYLQ